jgi:hypothetical protein
MADDGFGDILQAVQCELLQRGQQAGGAGAIAGS